MAMVASSFVTQFIKVLGSYAEQEAATLLGVPAEIKKLQRRLERIHVRLADAETRSIQDPVINHWLKELRDVMYEAEDIIEECMMKSSSTPTARVHRRNPLLPCISIGFRHEIANRIKSLNLLIDEIATDKTALSLTPAPSDHHNESRVSRSTSPLVEPDLVGERIEEDTRSLAQLLTKERDNRKIPVFAIVGMGGIGKTTLAQKICHHEKLLAYFYPVSPIWVCVSQDFSEIDLLRAVIRGVRGNPGETRERGALERMLSQIVEGQKFLLVLDDVWDARVSEDLLRKPLQSCGVGARVLVTTRNEAVARDMRAVHTHGVSKLSDQESWLLLRKMVLPDGDDGEVEALAEVGMEIAKKCNGLPLAIKTIAGTLRTRDLRPASWDVVLRNPAWSLAELPEGVMGALYLSYEDLPPPLKQCFVYLALFPEDSILTQGILARLWIAEGFVEEKENVTLDELATGYWEELVRRSLLQPDPAYYNGQGCKMHDLLRSLALHLARDECFFGNVQRFTEITSSTSSPSKKLRRLYIMDAEAKAFPDELKEQTYLRTAMLLIPQIEQVPNNYFARFKCLRILDLTLSGIEKLPESVGSLLHLRYLELSKSKIRELPESIRKLQNLRSLILINCENLHSLPKGVTTLSKLQNLNLEGTRMDRMPKGVGSLRHLHMLLGYVASSSKTDGSLEELKSLSKLSGLSLHQLEKAASAEEAREAAIQAKRHLIDLSLHCTPQDNHQEEEIKRVGAVFEELCPPKYVQMLLVADYFGLEFPTWIASPSSLGSLRRLELRGCILCERLPALGLLPQLDYLDITGASKVTSIGPELFGGSASTRVAFPKLKHLFFCNLPNWEQWLWLPAEEGRATARPLPQLVKLVLDGCPKLKSLPDGLMCNATSLTNLGLSGTHALEEVKNLPSVNLVCAINCPNLKKVSNLSSLRRLQLNGCRELRDVDGLDAMQHLFLEDQAMESLPEWLVSEGGVLRFGALQSLDIKSNAGLLSRCVVDGPDWHKIQNIARVRGFTPAVDKGAYIYYSRTPYSFFSNLPHGAADNSGSSSVSGVDAAP